MLKPLRNMTSREVCGCMRPSLPLLTDIETPKLQKRLKMKLSRMFHITHCFFSPHAIEGGVLLYHAKKMRKRGPSPLLTKMSPLTKGIKRKVCFQETAPV